mmetsp:Transcript_1962/g.3989  ORF Transcript_1962/g.3989 Transcript_1962/m.3989 type:complete len:206 (+) Transcript_1962:197-814(+)
MPRHRPHVSRHQGYMSRHQVRVLQNLSTTTPFNSCKQRGLCRLAFLLWIPPTPTCPRWGVRGMRAAPNSAPTIAVGSERLRTTSLSLCAARAPMGLRPCCSTLGAAWVCPVSHVALDEADDFRFTLLLGERLGCVRVLVIQCRVCAPREKQLAHLEVSLVRGPVQRCVPVEGFVSERLLLIDIVALINQHLGNHQIVVLGSPMQG